MRIIQLSFPFVFDVRSCNFQSQSVSVPLWPFFLELLSFRTLHNSFMDQDSYRKFTYQEQFVSEHFSRKLPPNRHKNVLLFATVQKIHRILQVGNDVHVLNQQCSPCFWHVLLKNVSRGIISCCRRSTACLGVHFLIVKKVDHDTHTGHILNGLFLSL